MKNVKRKPSRSEPISLNEAPEGKNPRKRNRLAQISMRFRVVAAQISSPNYIQFDQLAVWFYTICIGILLMTCLAGVHGSSISIFSSQYHYGAPGAEALLGTPRAIRVDEWNFHTPLIMNQYLRHDRFSPNDTVVGSGMSGLIANGPMWHFTSLFRPEFWGFFVLPFNYAYSLYWQAKWFILVTGLFTLLLLLTHSSLASAFGALWFLFSASTQWQLSWPSLLPDMVGLCCWIACLVCYLLVATNLKRAAIPALCLVGCAVDFAMCAYIPHQIPLVWFVLLIVGFWISTRASVIWDPLFRWRRIAVLGVAACAIGVVMGVLYVDIAETVNAVANTSYPGHRSMGGGSINLVALGSDLLDLGKTETHFPSVLGNICEGTGFFWLAPVTLFCFGRIESINRTQKIAFVFLGLMFLSIWFWEILPIPPSLARFTLFDRVGCSRALPALGLVNVVLVTLVLTWRRVSAKRPLFHHLVEGAAIFSLVLILMGLVNLGLGSFYNLATIAASAALLSIAAKCLLEGWVLPFGLIILVPSIIAYALVNPLDRGFDTIFRSDLFKTVQSRPKLLKGKWLVFSPSPTASGFFSAVGCSVYNGLKYVPDLKGLTIFDPTGTRQNTVNQSGYLVVDLPAPGSSADFESPSLGITVWRINPLDSQLRKIGIRYVAFQSQPPPDVLLYLKPVATNPISSFWLYELP